VLDENERTRDKGELANKINRCDMLKNLMVLGNLGDKLLG
jgi:hypothetical protein